MTNFNIKTICKVSRNCEGLMENPRKGDVAALTRFCLTHPKSYISRFKPRSVHWLKSFAMAEVGNCEELPSTDCWSSVG